MHLHCSHVLLELIIDEACELILARRTYDFLKTATPCFMIPFAKYTDALADLTAVYRLV